MVTEELYNNYISTCGYRRIIYQLYIYMWLQKNYITIIYLHVVKEELYNNYISTCR